MNRSSVAAALTFLLSLSACGREPTFTLYRTSSYARGMRIHWATFDVAGPTASYEPTTANQGNCQMAADLLNKNVREGNGGAQPVRFWCEKGPYRS
jgi:hypothetical protein